MQKEAQAAEDAELKEAQDRLDRSTNADGSYTLHDPNQERVTVFNSLCKTLQKGLLLGDVDLINDGLKEQADEKIVEECVRVGLFEMEPTE